MAETGVHSPLRYAVFSFCGCGGLGMLISLIYLDVASLSSFIYPEIASREGVSHSSGNLSSLCVELPPVLHDRDKEEHAAYEARLNVWGPRHSSPLTSQVSESKVDYFMGADNRFTLAAANNSYFTIHQGDGEADVVLTGEWNNSLGADVELKGNFVGFHSIFQNSYPHFLLDHLPCIAWLRSVVPKKTKFLLLDTEMSRSILGFLDPSFGVNRVHWVNYSQVVHVTGVLEMLVSAETSPLLLRNVHWIRAARPWIGRLPRTAAPTVLYYSRDNPADVHNGRRVAPAHETDILASVRSALKLYQRQEKLVIYNGGQDGKTMTVMEQARLFRSARLSIGSNGGGFANIIWMKNCGDVIEFVCKGTSGQAYPAGCPLTATFYWGYATAPWLHYHHVGFASNSSAAQTFIELSMLDQALAAVMKRWR